MTGLRSAYHALHEAGLKVSDDVSIVSFDDEDLASHLRPGPTTARLPYKEMGQKATELVLARDPRDRSSPRADATPTARIDKLAARDVKDHRR
jgi:DNA-binding LacI/PurR family transcriptional regulator